MSYVVVVCLCGLRIIFFFQAEDGIRDLVRSRGLGDVYKRQAYDIAAVTRCQLPAFGFVEAAKTGGLQASLTGLNLSLIHI